MPLLSQRQRVEHATLWVAASLDLYTLINVVERSGLNPKVIFGLNAGRVAVLTILDKYPHEENNRAKTRIEGPEDSSGSAFLTNTKMALIAPHEVLNGAAHLVIISLSLAT